MEIRQLNFDVSRDGVQHRLSVVTGDTLSRTVVARFFSGSAPIPLTAAYLRGLRPDGGEILAECEVEDNAAAYTFTTTDLSCLGQLQCEFDLHSGDAVMTSPRFAVMVSNKLYSGDGVEGSDEYEAYVSALLKLENITATAESGDTASASATVTDSAVELHFVLPKGDKGDKGDAGADGYTPQKGVDYFTTEDQTAMETAVEEAVTDNVTEAFEAALADKVDKVGGKGLSQNDYTDADRAVVTAAKAGFAAIETIEPETSATSILRTVSLRRLRLLVTKPTASSGNTVVTLEFDNGKRVSQYIGADAVSARLTLDIGNGFPAMTYAYNTRGDANTNTALVLANSIERVLLGASATKLTKITLSRSGGFADGTKFELYGVTA